MPTHVGANRIDKLYLGTTPVTAMYMGTERVYPISTTWERWSLKWPLATGQEGSYARVTPSQKLNWDGTLNAKKNLDDVFAGDVVLVYDIYRYCVLVDEDTRRRLLKEYSPNAAPTPLRDAYIDTVEDIDENAYPTNGISGGYWYVRK